MEAQPFDNITITQITKKAGVARLTFYRHFSVKEDIIRAWSTRMFRQFISTLQQPQSLAELLQQGLIFALDHRPEILLINKNQLTTLITQALAEDLMAALQLLPHSPQLTPIQLKFLQGGLSTILFDSFTLEETQSPEAITAEILKLLHPF